MIKYRKPQEGNTRVALVGPYVTHNFGDDLIGAVLARSLLSQHKVDVLLASMSKDNQAWVGTTPKSRNRDALLESDAILVGGGGILGDSGMKPTNRYLLSAVKAALFGKATGRPVLVNAVGAGPLSLPSSRILCRTLCRLAAGVGVRDRESAEFLVQDLGVSPLKVTSGADVAVLWPHYLKTVTESVGTLGIQFDIVGYESALRSPAIYDISKTIVDFCESQANHVTLVSNYSSGTQLQRHFTFAPRSLQYSFLPGFLSRLRGLEAIVTSHLHLAIAAYAARIPCFSIYVRGKTARFYDQIGHRDRAIDVSTASPAEVRRLLKSATAAQWTDDDENHLRELQARATQLIELSAQLLH